MRSRKMHVLGLILFVVATASAQEKPTNPVELTGTVKSETGAPLAGVDILITRLTRGRSISAVFDGMIDSMCFDASAVKW